MVEKFQSKIIRLGEFLRVAIPPEISNDVDLADQTPVSVYVNDQGNIEIEIEKSDSETTMCSICGRHKASKKCINCRRYVCLKCFWVFGSLCKKCARR